MDVVKLTGAVLVAGSVGFLLGRRGGLTAAQTTAVTARIGRTADRLRRIARSQSPTGADMATPKPVAAVPQTLTDVLAKLDQATTAVAAKINTLKDQVKTSMTQAEVDSVVSGLAAVADKLTGLAADPADPVPADPTA